MKSLVQETSAVRAWRLVGSRPALFALVTVFIALCASALEATPAVDWDEGWTLSVARNWVERGFYGRLLHGELAPPGLEASFPVVSTVALSMRLMGVGVWQGRLAAMATMLVGLALLYLLTRRLFGARPAWATLGILVLLIPHPQLNVFWMARQVYAEPLMFVMILGGLIGLVLARTRSRLWLVAACICFGTALVAKAQAQPFVVIALATAILTNVRNRRVGEAARLGLVFAGSLIGWRIWALVPGWLFGNNTMPPEFLPEALLVFGLVPSLSIRVTAVVVAALTGTTVIAGLAYWLLRRVRRGRVLMLADGMDDIRIALWSLSASWLLWYLIGAHAGITRYLFSPLFFGAPFAAVMLGDWTNGFDLRWTLDRLAGSLSSRRIGKRELGAWVAFSLVLFYLTLTQSISLATWSAKNGLDSLAAAEYLNNTASFDAVIETYESPLFVNLERRYHYPSDALHLELNKFKAGLPAVVNYDALEQNPDYIVVGPTGRNWKLYDATIKGGTFVVVRSFGEYEIYKRAVLP